MTVFGDGLALLFVRQVVVNLGKQVVFAFIVIKILSRDEIVQEIRLEIAQEKTAAAHDIKGALGNTALYAAQGDVQVYLTLLKNQRHLYHIIYGAVVY